MTKKQIIINIIIVTITALILSFIGYKSGGDITKVRESYQERVITNEEFNKYVDEKEIVGIVYSPDTDIIRGVLTSQAKIKYGMPESESGKVLLGNVLESIEKGEIDNRRIKEQVDESITIYTTRYRSTFTTVMIIGLIVVWVIHIVKKKTGDTGEKKEFGKSKAQTEKAKIPVIHTKLGDIKGHNEVMEDIQFIIKMLKDPTKYEKIGAKVPKGVLLYGPPGTGKTMIAKAIANEAKVPFYAAGGSDFVEKYVGVGARRVRELFEMAKKEKQAIIYIDEIDGIGKKRDGSENDERVGTLNALLIEMDGFDTSDNIIVIGSTNRVDILDDALLRPGRFDKHIAISNPDTKGRYELLRMYIEGKSVDKNIDIEYLSKITRGFSGADIANLMNEAALLTAFRGKDKITIIEVDDAYYKIVTKGDKKKDYVRSLQDTEITAWHEAGHTIISKLIAKQNVNKVTIVPSTSGAGGITLMEPKEGDYYSKKDLENMVKICYGGRAAEHILLGDEDKVTTGASNDIEKATNIILSMVGSYGMSGRFGLLNITKIQGYKVDTLISEAKEIADKIYEETRIFLEANYGLLKDIAERLKEKETLDEKEIDLIISEHTIVDTQETESKPIRLIGVGKEGEQEAAIKVIRPKEEKGKIGIKEKIFSTTQEKEKKKKLAKTDETP